MPTTVKRRRQAPSAEIVDAELVDLAEQIRLGARVDVKTLVESTPAQPTSNEPVLGNRHLKPAETHLFRPLGEGHGDRRRVPVGNMPTLIRAGWTTHCPFCGKRNCTQELNTCPGMEKKQFTYCPVCHKRIQDEIEGEGEYDISADPEEYEIRIAPNTTPEDRLRNRLAIHMRTFHPQAAMQYGFIRVPTAPTPRTDLPLQGGEGA